MNTELKNIRVLAFDADDTLPKIMLMLDNVCNVRQSELTQAKLVTDKNHVAALRNSFRVKSIKFKKINPGSYSINKKKL